MLQLHQTFQEEPQEQGLDASLQQIESLHWQSEKSDQTNELDDKKSLVRSQVKLFLVQAIPLVAWMTTMTLVVCCEISFCATDRTPTRVLIEISI